MDKTLIVWDRSITADQQARTLITILTAQADVMERQIKGLEAQVDVLEHAIERVSK